MVSGAREPSRSRKHPCKPERSADRIRKSRSPQRAPGDPAHVGPILRSPGDHSANGTLLDLRLAASLLSPQGVVFLDDTFNPSWPGVHTGLTQFLRLQSSDPRGARSLGPSGAGSPDLRGARSPDHHMPLTPIAQCGNKLVLTRAGPAGERVAKYFRKCARATVLRTKSPSFQAGAPSVRAVGRLWEYREHQRLHGFQITTIRSGLMPPALYD